MHAEVLHYPSLLHYTGSPLEQERKLRFSYSIYHCRLTEDVSITCRLNKGARVVLQVALHVHAFACVLNYFYYTVLAYRQTQDLFCLSQ